VVLPVGSRTLRCGRSAVWLGTGNTGGRSGGALPVGPSNEEGECDTGIRTFAEAA
jgi:hypothetical protein